MYPVEMRARIPIAGLLLAGVAGCHSAPVPAIVQPGAPGEPSRVVTSGTAADLSHVQFTAADVRFMQGMISHHRQAVEMTDLLETRTTSEDMKKLALRIRVSQSDEIGMMQRWLEARGQAAPAAGGHDMGGMSMPGMSMPAAQGSAPAASGMMPGMLTPEQMAALAAARGPAFDKLFLEGMIRHHAGALAMVQTLFETPGAGQESDIFAFASDVSADQRMEIDRMTIMLRGFEK